MVPVRNLRIQFFSERIGVRSFVSSTSSGWEKKKGASADYTYILHGVLGNKERELLGYLVRCPVIVFE